MIQSKVRKLEIKYAIHNQCTDNFRPSLHHQTFPKFRLNPTRLEFEFNSVSIKISLLICISDDMSVSLSRNIVILPYGSRFILRLGSDNVTFGDVTNHVISLVTYVNAT